MERKLLYQDELERSSSAEEYTKILREIQTLILEILQTTEREREKQVNIGPPLSSLEDYTKRCREFKNFLVEIKEKMQENQPAERSSTSKDPSKVSAEHSEEDQERDCLMDGHHEELHARIREGDIESVEHLLQDVKPGLPLCFEGMSALKRSFSCKQVIISTFLIRCGLIFKDDEEGDNLDISEEDVDLINIHLWYFNRDVEESCIYKLMVQSKLAFEGDKNSNHALLCMYKELFESECIRHLMKVLEKEQPHIVYDFGSKNIDRIYFEVETGLSGITVPSTNSIYIGAEELMSEKAEERAKVKGVVAEEFCHLALQYLFKNGSKPYKAKEENSDKVISFKELTSSLESDAKNEENLPPIIKDLFIGGVYESGDFQCELIARVPHLMGIYGEEKVRDKFKNSSKFTQLIKFYDDHVTPACKSFTNPLFYSRPMMELQSLHKEKGYILTNEKIGITFRDDFNFFEEHLVDCEGLKVLYSNITKLCALQMYHEFKERIKYHVDKVCLFFTLETFQEIKDHLIQKCKSELIQYLVLIVGKIQIESVRKALDSSICGADKPKVIIISFSEDPNSGGIYYKWNDVPFEFKQLFLERSFHFKGKKCCFKDHLEIQDLTKVFEKDIETFQILTSNGEDLRLDDGAELSSQHYDQQTYVMRKFQALTVDRKIFDDPQSHIETIFLSGLKKSELEELALDEGMVQWLQGPDDEIQCDKSIIVVNKDAEMSFEEFKKRNPKETSIWLNYYEKEFYIRGMHPSSNSNIISHQITKKILSEEEILSFLKRERMVIISDNARYGKSTVISSLIDIVKRDKGSCNWRINFSKISGNETNPLSLANVEEGSSDEEVLSYFYRILGLKNGLEEELFRKFSREGHCFIFFDGFDEIPSKYLSNAQKLLSTVRKQSAVNMTISTGKHHEQELEQLLNTLSYELVPFSMEEQVLYLEKLWKKKLKNPNCHGTLANQNGRDKVQKKIKDILRQLKERKSKLDQELKEIIIALENLDLVEDLVELRSKIDDLKLTKLAELLIDKTSLDKEVLEFMGIPLHLFMIGTIYFNNDFNLEIQSDIYSIYSDFVEQKILLFVEEKQGWIHAGTLKERTIENERKNAYRIHIELSNQLMDEGKVDRNMSEEDAELCASLGIVFIKGGEVDFLHHTFAEFFKAESIRLNLRKEDFNHLLFDDDYEVVSRFLSGALEKKNFENLTKEFFKDVDFVITLLKQFVYEQSFFSTSNFLQSNVAILKCLLEAFEEIVDQNTAKTFVMKLESELYSIEKWYSIGGCLTFRMLKMLLKRNFMVNFKMIFGVVRYYLNPEEVIKVLNECISIHTAGNCGRKKGKHRENKKAECLLNLLKIKNPAGNGFLYHAIWNSRIFAKILKFSRDILGEKQFINEIIQNENYRDLMDKFIGLKNYYEISEMLKACRLCFADEIDILFDNDLKFIILKRTLNIDYEKRNVFEEAINLFVQCFGIEKVKEVLIRHSSDGDYIVRTLVSKSRYVVQNLNSIRSILDEENKMKQILKVKDRELNNILHLSVRNQYVNFGHTLQFCAECLGKGKIKEMLLDANKKGEMAFYLIFVYQSPKMIIKISKFIRDTLGDKKLARQLLRIYIGRCNIFHFAAQSRNNDFRDVFQYCNENLEKDEIIDMLFSLDIYENGVLTLLISNNSSKMLIQNMNLIKDTLANKKLLKQLLMSDMESRNILHSAASSENDNFGDVLQFCNENLQKDEIKEMLINPNYSGNNSIHLLFRCNESIMVMQYINLIKDTIDDDQFFLQLLKCKNTKSRNILHLAAKNYNEINVSFLHLYLNEEEIKELLMEIDDDGETLLHRSADSHTTNILGFLDYLHEILKFDLSVFEGIILSANGDGNTFLHLLAKIHKDYDKVTPNDFVNDVIQSLKEKLSGDLLDKLLTIRNKDGCTYLQMERCDCGRCDICD